MPIKTQWQTGKRIFRTTVILGASYLAGVFTTVFQFPLWLWVTLEALQRYLPLWLQVVLGVIIGWQLDTLLQWPLGSGVLLVVVIQILQLLARIPRSVVAQFLARIASFSVFALVFQRWWGSTNEGWLLLQIVLYSGLLLLNLYRRTRK